jgi:hypothetical protein
MWSMHVLLCMVQMKSTSILLPLWAPPRPKVAVQLYLNTSPISFCEFILTAVLFILCVRLFFCHSFDCLTAAQLPLQWKKTTPHEWFNYRMIAIRMMNSQNEIWLGWAVGHRTWMIVGVGGSSRLLWSAIMRKKIKLGLANNLYHKGCIFISHHKSNIPLEVLIHSTIW